MAEVRLRLAMDPEILAREETIWTEVGATHAEAARGAFNREWGKRIEAATGIPGDRSTRRSGPAGRPTGRPGRGHDPPTVHPGGATESSTGSIPQTRWPCRTLRGAAVRTVRRDRQDLPDERRGARGGAVPRRDPRRGDALPMGWDARTSTPGCSGGADRSCSRSSGRRPCPSTSARSASGPKWSPRVGSRSSNHPSRRPADVLRVKEATPEKSYRVGVWAEVPWQRSMRLWPSSRAERSLSGRRTRVAHRRSDLVRSRRIQAARLVEASEGRFTLDLRAEAGTYIKEWAEGDGGRTEPNLAGLVQAPVTVEFLDVLEIHDTE